MALIVQKFGGTSVADIDKIKNVAQKVINVKKAGNKVVVVLSAMAGETDRLIDMAHRAAETPNEREYDSLISTGDVYDFRVKRRVARSDFSFRSHLQQLDRSSR